MVLSLCRSRLACVGALEHLGGTLSCSHVLDQVYTIRMWVMDYGMKDVLPLVVSAQGRFLQHPVIMCVSLTATAWFFFASLSQDSRSKPFSTKDWAGRWEFSVLGWAFAQEEGCVWEVVPYSKYILGVYVSCDNLLGANLLNELLGNDSASHRAAISDLTKQCCRWQQFKFRSCIIYPPRSCNGIYQKLEHPDN